MKIPFRKGRPWLDLADRLLQPLGLMLWTKIEVQADDLFIVGIRGIGPRIRLSKAESVRLNADAARIDAHEMMLSD